MSELRHVLSIDPGKSNGVALGSYSDTQPYTLLKCWQFGGGPEGLHDWVAGNLRGDWDYPTPDYTVAEKFTPLQNKGFAQTLDSTLPLVGEGVLMSLGVMPWYPHERWRRPQSMYIFGGSNLKERKSKAQKFIRDNGMYVTGKMVGAKDADDARSAIWHGIAFLVKQKHAPTVKMILDWSGQ